MIQAMRSLHSNGSITDEQYNYCLKHWDEWLSEFDPDVGPTEKEEYPYSDDKYQRLSDLNSDKVDESVIKEPESKIVKVEVSDIKWDCDDQDPDEIGLPDNVTVNLRYYVDGDMEEQLSDVLSDHFGYCHNGFNYKVVDEETDGTDGSEYDEELDEVFKAAGLEEGWKDAVRNGVAGLAMGASVMGANPASATNNTELKIDPVQIEQAVQKQGQWTKFNFINGEGKPDTMKIKYNGNGEFEDEYKHTMDKYDLKALQKGEDIGGV